MFVLEILTIEGAGWMFIVQLAELCVTICYILSLFTMGSDDGRIGAFLS